MIETWAALMIGLFATSFVGIACAKAGQLYERRKWEKRLVERAGLTFDTPIGATPSLPASALSAGQPDARLERLEHAVDAIAVEMERVGEGQRFVTKLLAERKKTPGEITPRSPVPGTIRPPA
jgi:hypothetical protein